ncbi:hypothetical protein ATK78_3153 [Pedobacter metabolipauper]|uniref:Uncharacterized protein n=1 Tax=Pedobacter metabolipauper TaxID=425513 RepID=A0A4R6STF5_9SPHI|nr:hypothetical protein ATK78_3153 [Pedobacter metabolipauper]
MGCLLEWFEVNRNWKDGAYFDSPKDGADKPRTGTNG